jgi:hypothetical protein
MKPRLNDYYAPIGTLTIAAATLEEIAIRWAALLSEADVDETRYKNLTRGLESNLTLLADRVRECVSSASQKSVLDLIEKGRTLKNKRNENVHGVWGEMVHEDTGEFAHVARSRHEKDKATRTTKWDVSVPPIEELNKLTADLHKVAHELNNRLSDLGDIDQDVQRWRSQHNY